MLHDFMQIFQFGLLQLSQSHKIPSGLITGLYYHKKYWPFMTIKFVVFFFNFKTSVKNKLTE